MSSNDELLSSVWAKSGSVFVSWFLFLLRSSPHSTLHIININYIVFFLPASASNEKTVVFGLRSNVCDLHYHNYNHFIIRINGRHEVQFSRACRRRFQFQLFRNTPDQNQWRAAIFLYIFFVFFCFRQMQHTYRGAMCEQAFCVLLCVKRRRRESGEHNLTLTLPVNGVF